MCMVAGVCESLLTLLPILRLLSTIASALFWLACFNRHQNAVGEGDEVWSALEERWGKRFGEGVRME